MLLTKDDLLNAYEILEHSLNKLYPNTDKENIYKLVAQVKRRKDSRLEERIGNTLQ